MFSPAKVSFYMVCFSFTVRNLVKITYATVKILLLRQWLYTSTTSKFRNIVT